MHNRDSFPGEVETKWPSIPDIKQRPGGEHAGRLLQLEYEGLDSGELAWILGRRFIHQEGDNRGNPDITDGGMGTFRAFQASAHGLGIGAGPDRMQRLAYTSWVEAFFRAQHGTKVINLSSLSLASQKGRHLSSVLDEYGIFIAGGTVLSAPDVPYAIESRTNPVERLPNMLYTNDAGNDVAAAQNVHGGGFACGLFVMEKGPFLRGKMINSDPVDVHFPNSDPKNISHTLPRNLGDEIAFEALFAELRAQGMFDWTPDGMVLSKLESPSGEPISNAELDARSGQLFNIAIQGPAVTKTWTGDPMMQCMPMDKVFIVMVADVNARIRDVRTEDPDGTRLGLQAMEEYLEWVKNPQGSAEAFKSKMNNAVQSSEQGFGNDPWPNGEGHAKAVKQRFTAYANAAKPSATPDDKARVTEQRLKMEQIFQHGNGSPDWAATAAKLKNGTVGVDKCTMSNFRLMRVTSSFLSSYSHVEYDANGAIKKESRCGLRAGTRDKSENNSPPGLANNTEICSEFIIGGWCIGTVLDSAASRSTVGHLVRTAPASMAINVNVNIEWWSGDKLYKHYMDVDGTVHQRGQRPDGENAVEKRNNKTDVNMADRAEKQVWRKRLVD